MAYCDASVRTRNPEIRDRGFACGGAEELSQELLALDGAGQRRQVRQWSWGRCTLRQGQSRSGAGGTRQSLECGQRLRGVCVVGDASFLAVASVEHWERVLGSP
ncbi:hypothetical protein NDU88_007266 [Pleurodeles waltl]|uniref:Uncharacterized protein n=1 Tax=Pleurodeles waltl TaxID=8319 RepID=A0AAV7N5F2_PLEWA|nr:hypothetical protein NDU88_007266 [Pleurodeles waltl]